MNNDQMLQLYLNDHLAGSAAGIRHAKSCRDRNAPSALADVLNQLIPQIEEDQLVLKELIGSIHGSRSVIRRGAGWIAARALSIKLTAGGKQYRPLTRVQELEVLFLGVRGKLALWELLETLNNERLAGTDFSRLRQRAAKQLEALESQRLAAGLKAFGGERDVHEVPA